MKFVVHLPLLLSHEPAPVRGRRKREQRAVTENVDHIPKGRLEEERLEVTADELLATYDRPRVRGECEPGGEGEHAQRPCPFVACRYNLFLDLDDTVGQLGSLKYNFPDLAPEQIPPAHSCALDTADDGGTTLEIIGDMMNLTRERIRQMEARALERLGARAGMRALRPFLDDFPRDEGGGPLAPVMGSDGGTRGPSEPEEKDPNEEHWTSAYSPGRMPRMGNGDPEAEAAWLLHQDERNVREGASAGASTLNGIPMNQKTARAVDYIVAYNAEHGRGPSQIEIADALGMPGSNEASRQSAVSMLLRGFRQAGAIQVSRAGGARIVGVLHGEGADEGGSNGSEGPRRGAPARGDRDGGRSPVLDAHHGDRAPDVGVAETADRARSCAGGRAARPDGHGGADVRDGAACADDALSSSVGRKK